MKSATLAIAASLIFGSTTQLAHATSSSTSAYDSPYSFVFDVPIEQLLAPNQLPPRNNPHLESQTPYEHWYTENTRRRFRAWGPAARTYPPIENFTAASTDWKRERVLAVAQSYIGLPYQHHHIPDWDPPKQWPWKPVAYGRNSKGVDCSDFSSWVYNYGLGIRLPTGIREQAFQEEVTGAGAIGTLTIKKIRNEDGYEDLVRKLKPGDLLYIRQRNVDEISHVIIWLGRNGKSPDGAPLVIDCTGNGHTDCNGKPIPVGVNVRPFLHDSWYYRSFNHANRIIAPTAHEDK